MKVKDLTIEIISQKCEKILETLPLSHYLKVDTIPVKFDKDSETSYFEPERFRINVALKNVLDAIAGSKKTEITDYDLEKHLRCLLYHEISHAILTPRDLMLTANEKERYDVLNPMFANIIEDERIESILGSFYYGVDFKENLRNICKINHSTSFENFVFNCVRHRYSPVLKTEINNSIDDFIISNEKITANGSARVLCNSMDLLLKYLKDIWKKYIEPKTDSKEDSSISDSPKDSYKSKGSSEQSGMESSSGSIPTEEGTDDKGKPSSSSVSSDSTSKTGTNPNETEDEEQGSDDKNLESLESKTFDNEEIEKIVDKAMRRLKEIASNYGSYSMKLEDFEEDTNATIELLKIITRNSGTGVYNEPAEYGYTGKFDAKRFFKDYNESYKWFKKKSFEGSTQRNKSSKKILNIWLDQSGSFGGNDDSVNVVLRSLYEIEKKRKDFEWRLIRMTCNCNIEKDKSKRYSKSFSGNALPVNKIRQIYEETNKTKQELNIVLFDGHANSLDFGSGDEDMDYHETYSFDALKPFNNNKTIFITESSNTARIKAICSQARDVIEQNHSYAPCLKQNILTAFDMLF